MIPHCGFNFSSPGVMLMLFSCVLWLFVCPPLKDIPRCALIFTFKSFLFTAKLLPIEPFGYLASDRPTEGVMAMWKTLEN